MDHAAHEAERDIEQMPENRDERGENVSYNTEIKDLSCQIVEGLGEQRARQTESEKSDGLIQDIAVCSEFCDNFSGSCF